MDVQKLNPHLPHLLSTFDLCGLPLRNRVVMAPMNLCVESHMRDLVEQGFEVFVVTDATAAANSPELGDGFQAAVVNFDFIASKAMTTREAVNALR